MTDGTPTALRAAQLIYSNVEAEHSPSERRGFQVWLASPRLKEQQRDIARRLEDFEWPHKEAAANKVTERFTFFKTAAGDFVVARTVPLTERDALKRAGRFHAHAVVIPPREFARVGCDPFWVVDHFPFQGSPTPLIESGEWRKGLPDETDVAVGPPRDPDPAAAKMLAKALPVLLRWLDGPDDPRPVAIPVPPDRLAGILRAVFRALPPPLRERATFDTLSTGATLTAVPYRFAGAYDAQTLRDWPYRRAYRLDPETGDFPTPPEAKPNPGLDALAAAWAADPSVTDADRETSYRLLKCLSEPAPLPENLSEKALELVRCAPGAEASMARRTQAWLGSALPSEALRPLVVGPAAAWVGPLSPAALARLAGPPPQDEIAGWLLQAAEAAPRLDPQQAADLEHWAYERLKEAHGPAKVTFAKLYLIGLRWLPDGVTQLTGLRQEHGWAKQIDTWFQPWFLANTPIAGFLASDTDAEAFAEGVFQGSSRLAPDSLAELERFLAVVDPAAVHPPSYKRLAFAAAFRRGNAGRMAAVLEERDDEFTGWVFGQALKSGFTAHLAVSEVEGHPGIVLAPGPRATAEGAEALLEALGEHKHVRWWLYGEAVRRADELAPPPVIAPSAAAKALTAYESGRRDRIEEELAKLEPTSLRFLLEDRLLDKAQVMRIAHSLGDGSYLWVGPAVESNGNRPELFQVLYRAVAGLIARDPHKSEERVAALLGATRVRAG